jgi:hypothetical protein
LARKVEKLLFLWRVNLLRRKKSVHSFAVETKYLGLSCAVRKGRLLREIKIFLLIVRVVSRKFLSCDVFINDAFEGLGGTLKKDLVLDGEIFTNLHTQLNTASTEIVVGNDVVVEDELVASNKFFHVFLHLDESDEFELESDVLIQLLFDVFLQQNLVEDEAEVILFLHE